MTILKLLNITGDLYDMVLLQCLSLEDCKTNKEASETDLQTTVTNLKALNDAGLQNPG